MIAHIIFCNDEPKKIVLGDEKTKAKRIASEMQEKEFKEFNDANWNIYSYQDYWNSHKWWIKECDATY